MVLNRKVTDMKNLYKRIIAFILSLSLLITGTGTAVFAAEANPSKGKYLKDIYVAYGKTEEEARKWLTDNGWEPLQNGNVGLGKASAFDKEIAVMLGIKRTDDAGEAITDLAVMNMKGGYSFPDYQELIREKKTEINEFINTFIPTIEEFRKNYNGEGSALGKKRADYAYNVLNRFYDGSPEDQYAVNDTGMHLGDLFLSPLKQEMGDEAYNKLSDEEKKKHGDLEQIILESSGPAVLLIEQMLALAADDSENTWLERLSELSGDGLLKNLSKYAPEAEGKDLAPSAALQVLKQHFEDTASLMADEWALVNKEMQWIEQYCEQHDLWDKEGESDNAYVKRIEKFFNDLKKQDEQRYEDESKRFFSDIVLYGNLYEVPYEGEWGYTLGDFFNPYNGENYGGDTDQFLPFAAALSEGQRNSLEFLPMTSLLNMGFVDNKGFDQALPDMESVFKQAPELSVYSGINRGIFRYGVAVTSRARMEENMGKGRAFDQIYDPTGIMAITAYCAAGVGAVTLVTGAVLASKGTIKLLTDTENNIVLQRARIDLAYWQKQLDYAQEAMDAGYSMEAEAADYKQFIEDAKKIIKQETKDTEVTSMGVAGRWMMGIGGALLVAAAVVEAVQLAIYYNRTFTQIPVMIVDEADIVSYSTDENGDPVKQITFDQFVYYDAVKCNRQEVGKISDWQKGVDKYADDGCGDVADLNGDYGQEWLAMYTNRSLKKGDPILADSLAVQYGSDAMPKDHNKALHFFTYTYAMDLGDTAYSYNNKQKGIYLFWQDDAEAGDAERGNPAATASAFSTGKMGLIAAGGIMIGILGATLVLLPKKRKEEEGLA